MSRDIEIKNIIANEVDGVYCLPGVNDVRMAHDAAEKVIKALNAAGYRIDVSTPATRMSVADFKLHDRVNHVSFDGGSVTQHDGAKITVTFDRLTAKGRNVTGIYDDNWFRICPDTLYRVEP